MTFALFHQMKEYSLLYPNRFQECTQEDIFQYKDAIRQKEKGGLNHAGNRIISNRGIHSQCSSSGK